MTMQRTPPMIAIAGCSCSGKTTLALRLAEALRGTVLPVDAYYRDLAALPFEQRAGINFDTPEAIEEALLLEHARALSRGVAIERPVYDFETHLRTARTERVSGASPVILEGLFALYWRPIRQLCRVKAFVELEHRDCLERRLIRDVRERRRTRESVLRQYEDTVRPMAERYILPTRQFADLTVRGDEPAEEAVRKIISCLNL